MPLQPSTRPSGSAGRRSSAFGREEPGRRAASCPDPLARRHRPRCPGRIPDRAHARHTDRHHPAVPDLLGDLPRRAHGTAQRDRHGAAGRGGGVMSAHRVVIVGGGFGGLEATRGLRGAPVEITLIDRRNFHLFQPLTYQVATGALSPGEVAYPLRAMFKRNRNVRVLLAEVDRFDLERRELVLRSVGGLPAPEPVPYDTLIVAGGSHYSYFGHDEWSAHAAEVKSLESALTVRSGILGAFEAAELERDPARRSEYLTFVVVGAGPTGVEMAGQIAELARDTLRRDFRAADPGSGRILLVEAADRVLTGFPPSSSAKAERS